MSAELEQLAEDNARLHSAIVEVRGRAETPGGTVAVETDVNGTITDLRIEQSAMSVEPARLAQAITQCHQEARERAQAEATRVFAELRDQPEASTGKVSPDPRSGATEWEELNPLRITHSL
ncbi:YbaB/EbfC family nucleoid-associated protein [Nocardia sp. NPDC059246]|uniref:YbaB/EbfC family nucleoid-associated protein n=1 Tax=unclassified Nocardia TaxID=2637762 RepID=UPI0036994519